MPPLLVGLAGGSCSGKSTLAGLLRERLVPIPAAVITTDRYYRSLGHLPADRRPLQNFDSPEMLDRELLEGHLLALKAGEAVDLPVYDFRLHTRAKETETLSPPPVILVEGLFLLADPRLRTLFDLTVFVKTAPDVRLARRIRRDRKERGRTVEEILERYFAQVRPAYRKLSGPSRENADLVVNGEGDPEAAARTAGGRIAGLLSRAPGERE